MALSPQRAWSFPQALAFERLLLVVKTQPVTLNPPPRPRISDLRPVNENTTASYPARPPDAHQRVPLEPLFHIDTEAHPAVQPMSIDEASSLHSMESLAQTHPVNGSSHGHVAGDSLAAQPYGQHALHQDSIKSEDAGTVKNEDPGQVSTQRTLTTPSIA